MENWKGTLIVVAAFVALIILFALLPKLPTWIYIVVSLMAMGALVYVFARK